MVSVPAHLRQQRSLALQLPVQRVRSLAVVPTPLASQLILSRWRQGQQLRSPLFQTLMLGLHHTTSKFSIRQTGNFWWTAAAAPTAPYRSVHLSSPPRLSSPIFRATGQQIHPPL